MPPSLKGVLNLVDVVSTTTFKSNTASLAYNTILARRTNKPRTGSVAPTGALARRANRPRTGALSFSGSLGTEYIPASGGAGDLVIYGFGSVTTGGGSTVAWTDVSNVTQLKNAIAATGTRRIRFTAGGTYDLGGPNLTLNNGNVTIDGTDAPSNVIIKSGMFMVRANNVIIRNIRFRIGTQVASGGDADAVSVGMYNGSTQYDRIVLDHCELIWGPDVSATLLGGLSNVTVQYCIIGEGLFASTHPESYGGPLANNNQGHSLSLNVAAFGGHDRITLYSNLFVNSQSRSPRFQACVETDVINNVFYNFDEGPQGAVTGLNLINNYYKEGPAPAFVGLDPIVKLQFRSQTGGEQGSAPNGSVYLSGNFASNFTFATPSGTDASIISGSQKHTPSISGANLRTAQNAFTHVLANAGARFPTVDSTTQRLLDDAANGTGHYKSGYRWSTNQFFYPPIDHTW